MKNKHYFFLFYIFYIIISDMVIVKSSEIINEVFPFYPYNDIMKTNFEEFCLEINLEKDCIIEILSKLDIKNL